MDPGSMPKASWPVPRAVGRNFLYANQIDQAMEDPAFPPMVKKALCVLFIALGAILYLTWGIVYAAWNPFSNDYIGIYAVMVTLIGIGGIGLLILRLEEEEGQV